MKAPTFNPTMAWPEPSPLTPHQTTYGTEPMTSKDNPANGVTGVTDAFSERLARLEAWARQFPRTRLEAHMPDGRAVGAWNNVAPLDGMEPTS